MVNPVTEGNICRVGDANIGITNIGAADAGEYFSDTSTDGGAGCIGGVCTGTTSVNNANAGEGLLGAHMHGIGKNGERSDAYPFPDDGFLDEFSDFDNSFDSSIDNTVDRFMTDVAVEANFSDSAYDSDGSELDITFAESHSGNGLARNVDTNSDSSSGEDASCSEYFSANSDNGSTEIPYRVKKSANNDSIYLPVNINGVVVDALIDTGAQTTVINEGLADILGLTTDDVVFMKGASVDSTVKARYCPKITFKIDHLLYKWHCMVAPIEDDFILGLDFLLKFKVDILVSNGVVAIGNKYTNLDASQPVMSDGDVFEVNKVVVDNSIIIPAWSAKFVKIPFKCKLGDWKTFEARPYDNVLISNTVFNAKDGFLTLFIINMNKKRFKLKRGKIIGVATDIFGPELAEEREYEVVDLEGNGHVLNACPTREVGTQVNLDDIHCDTFRIASLKTLLTVKQECRDIADVYPAKQSDKFEKILTILPEHVRDLFQRSLIHLSFFQSIEVACLFIEFASVFSKNDLDIGVFKLIKHRIRLYENFPLKFKLRPTPFHFQKEEESHIKAMLDAGIIQPSSSDWAAPVCLVRKRCGGVRVCTDYRGLNKISIKDAYPLPRINDCLDTLAGNRWFSNIDMASGYWQVEVNNSDRHLTAFITRYGLFEYVRMPFGLAGAPATFQRIVELVLSGLLWKKAVAYLDDVTILGADFESALNNLREVLGRFAEHNLKLKPKKCHLFQKSIEFLGRVVDSEGVSIKPAHIKQIEEWPVPSTKKELESFLGFVNYHRDHVPKFAHLSEPLYKFVSRSPGGKIELPPELIEAVFAIKKLLMDAPVLKYPSPDHVFILNTDASDTAIGGELLQMVNDREHIVCFGSYILTPEQRKYCTTRKELLAVVRFTRQFRHYLLGRQFIVRTDHSSLVWLLSFKNIEGQLSRWIEELSQYDMVVVHRPGKFHVNADALSRIPDTLKYCENYNNNMKITELPCYPCRYCERAQQQWAKFTEEVDYIVPLSVRRIQLSTDALYTAQNWGIKYSPVELRSHQENDHDLAVIINWLENGVNPTEGELALASPAVKHFWIMNDQLFFENNVLYYQWADARFPRKLLVVPQGLKNEILEYFHDHSYAGHMGRDNTCRNIKTGFYWYQLYADVAAHVKSCAACSRNKTTGKKRKAGMVRYHAGSPMERVHIDILGPFNISSRGNKYILCMVDQFTKWLESVPLPDQSAEKVAMAAIDNFFCTFGMPLTIHTDQGANFVGNVFKTVCDLLEIRKTQTTPYYPQGNGQVERYNRTMIEMIRCLKAKSEKDWDIYLPHITSAIRCLENPSTGFSANRLMLGREVSKPAHVHFGMSSPVSVSGSDYIKRLDFVMRETHRIARENLKGTLLRRKRDYDVKLKQESYEVGDFVYKLNFATKKGVSKKLQPLYDGPFIVTRVLSPVLIEIENRKRKKVVHHNKLKPCNDRFIPLWIRRRRQELLSLDDTLPYDADEHSFFNISDLFAQNDPHDIDLVVDDLNPSVDDQPGRGDQSTLANVSANDNEIPQTPNIDDISDNQDDNVPDNGVDVIAVPNAQDDPVSDFEGNISPVPVRTRRGRTIRPNTLLRDFITY